MAVRGGNPCHIPNKINTSAIGIAQLVNNFYGNVYRTAMQTPTGMTEEEFNAFREANRKSLDNALDAFLRILPEADFSILL